MLTEYCLRTACGNNNMLQDVCHAVLLFVQACSPLSYHLKLAVLCIYGYTLLHDKVSC